MEANCKFVVKIIEHRHREGYEPITKDLIQSEISVQQQFNKANLSPPIIEAFFCETTNKSYIITLPKQSTLADICHVLAMRNNYCFRTKEAKEDLLKIVALVQRAIELLCKAHSQNLFHGDSHMYNFMTDGTRRDIDNNFLHILDTLSFIDFGTSNALTEYNLEKAFDDFDFLMSSLMEQPYGSKVFPYLDLCEFKARFNLIYS